jgi:tRNA 2-thiouridine synthesizing protein E
MGYNQLPETTGEGFLVDSQAWSEAIAKLLAEQEGIALSDAHWEILYFAREFYREYEFLPNSRQFSKAIAKTLGTEKGSSRYLHGLFPSSPLKYAFKLAGLPKPPTCL